jgi:hypothetical protein
MGHVQVGGLRMTIETPKGRIRRGQAANGHKWAVKMPAHYGYIKGTEGADGDHVDTYLGPHAHEAHHYPVHIVDQHDARTGRFDEHKALVGFASREHAVTAYDAAFSDGRGPDRRKAVHTMTFQDFRHWVGNGDTTRPLGKSLAAGIAGAAIAGAGARWLGRGIARQGIRLSSRKIYTEGLKQAVRDHLRTFEGNVAPPHVRVAAKQAFRAAKRRAVQDAIRNRDVRLSQAHAPRWGVAGAAAAGGIIGLRRRNDRHKLPDDFYTATPTDQY